MQIEVLENIYDGKEFDSEKRDRRKTTIDNRKAMEIKENDRGLKIF